MPMSACLSALLLLSPFVTSTAGAHGGNLEARPATDDWCINGTPLDIGECLCKLQLESACQGSKCFRQMGLSWYKPSCPDCSCLPEPTKTGDKETNGQNQAGSHSSTKPATKGQPEKATASGDCDKECEWKPERDTGDGDASAAKNSLPATGTNALPATTNAQKGYTGDDNDEFDDGLSSDDYLNLLDELEAQANSRSQKGSNLLIAAAAVGLSLILMVVYRLAVPAPRAKAPTNQVNTTPAKANESEAEADAQEGEEAAKKK